MKIQSEKTCKMAKRQHSASSSTYLKNGATPRLVRQDTMLVPPTPKKRYLETERRQKQWTALFDEPYPVRFRSIENSGSKLCKYDI